MIIKSSILRKFEICRQQKWYRTVRMIHLWAYSKHRDGLPTRPWSGLRLLMRHELHAVMGEWFKRRIARKIFQVSTNHSIHSSLSRNRPYLNDIETMIPFSQGCAPILTVIHKSKSICIGRKEAVKVRLFELAAWYSAHSNVNKIMRKTFPSFLSSSFSLSFPSFPVFSCGSARLRRPVRLWFA